MKENGTYFFVSIKEYNNYMSILYIHCGISILNCLEEKNAYSFQYAKQYECILIFYLHNLIEITSNHFFLISNAKYVYAYNHA